MVHPQPSHHTTAEPSAIMRAVIVAALFLSVLSGCSSNHGRVKELNPDCTQVSADEQAKGNCMYRPEAPEGL
jgi:hypothetical protein